MHKHAIDGIPLAEHAGILGVQERVYAVFLREQIQLADQRHGIEPIGRGARTGGFHLPLRGEPLENFQGKACDDALLVVKII